MAAQTTSRVEGKSASENGRKQRPVWTKNGFPLTIAVFEFPSENGPPNFSVKLTRSFKRDEGADWENTEYLGGGDLLRAAKLLEAADAFVQSRLEADFRSANKKATTAKERSTEFLDANVFAPRYNVCIAGAFLFNSMRSQLPSQNEIHARVRVESGRESLVPAATAYLARGWPVVPLFGKLPAIHWKEYQSRLPTSSEIESWFVAGERRPSGLGIVTGKLSGLVVVDCDSNDDAAYWRESFPHSPLVVKTGGGGIHFYYLMPDGIEVRNRAGLFGRKIDVRGEGGYATAPPSLHPNGTLYAWQAYDAAATLPAFDADWLIDNSQPARLPINVQTTSVRNAVAYIRRIQATAGEGGHNATFRAACKLRDAGLSEDEALAVLGDWNETNASPHWSAADLVHKIRSAYSLAK